ncbi:hypothetical protein E4U21_000722 [Claviceps maximensis]|nr:hypothetical protein E4U21_000722 [Claviceps maximensis]
MNCGVSDRYRTVELPSSHSPAQDRGHALPPLRTNMFSYQTTCSRGPTNVPLDMSSERMFGASGDRAADYWMPQQLSAPKSAASEYSLTRPLGPSVPVRRGSSELKNLFDDNLDMKKGEAGAGVEIEPKTLSGQSEETGNT